MIIQGNDIEVAEGTRLLARNREVLLVVKVIYDEMRAKWEDIVYGRKGRPYMIETDDDKLRNTLRAEIHRGLWDIQWVLDGKFIAEADKIMESLQ